VDVGDVDSFAAAGATWLLEWQPHPEALLSLSSWRGGGDKRMASGVFSKDRLQPVADRNPSRNEVAQSGWRPAFANFRPA